MEHMLTIFLSSRQAYYIQEMQEVENRLERLAKHIMLKLIDQELAAHFTACKCLMYFIRRYFIWLRRVSKHTSVCRPWPNGAAVFQEVKEIVN